MHSSRLDLRAQTPGRPSPRGLAMSRDKATPGFVLAGAAMLLIAVSIIHIQDQGGLLGDQSPVWLKWGYYGVELGSLAAAMTLLRGWMLGWFVGIGASGGPMIGYLLSRSVGLPGDIGDIGNWGYVLGTVSLVVEATFLLMAVVCVRRAARAVAGAGDAYSVDTRVTAANLTST